MNKIHLEIQNDYSSHSDKSLRAFYKNARISYCGQSTSPDWERPDNLDFTNDLNKITCLQCVQQLFRDKKIELQWKR